MERMESGEAASFSHDENFPQEAIRWLEERGLKPEFGSNFKLHPGSEAYAPFLRFLISELEALPMDNQVGRAYLMRSDAKDIVKKLREFLAEKAQELNNGKEWDSEISSIADIAKDGRLEIFKNEIYPAHGTSGIGYNLDLSSHEKDGKQVPADIILERRYVDARNNLKVTDNGFFELNLSTGSLCVDLEEFPTRNIHRGADE